MLWYKVLLKPQDMSVYFLIFQIRFMLLSKKQSPELVLDLLRTH